MWLFHNERYCPLHPCRFPEIRSDKGLPSHRFS